MSENQMKSEQIGMDLAVSTKGTAPAEMNVFRRNKESHQKTPQEDSWRDQLLQRKNNRQATDTQAKECAEAGR